MTAPKHGQGAAKAAPEPNRTPERQALADAIAARAYVASLIEQKREALRALEAHRGPLYEERARLDELLPRAPNSDKHRLDALLRGEEPEAGVDRDAIKKQIADNEAQLNTLWAQSKSVQHDIELLEGDLQMRDMDVRDCVRKIVRSDPAQAAVAAELRALNARRAFLGRAADQALNEYEPGAPDRGNSSLGMVIVPYSTLTTPCPWAEAKARLLTDPDAVLPLPADV